MEPGLCGNLVLYGLSEHCIGSVPLPPDSILRGTKAARSGKVLTEFDPSLLYRLGPRTIKAAQKLNEYFYRQGK